VALNLSQGKIVPVTIRSGSLRTISRIDSGGSYRTIASSHDPRGWILSNDRSVDPFGRSITLYGIVAARYENKATIITSNKSLTEWGKVLHDTSLAGALVDRLMHHGDVYYLKGDSYRLSGKEKRQTPPPAAG